MLGFVRTATWSLSRKVSEIGGKSLVTDKGSPEVLFAPALKKALKNLLLAALKSPAFLKFLASISIIIDPLSSFSISTTATLLFSPNVLLFSPKVLLFSLKLMSSKIILVPTRGLFHF